ncbi:alpha/beta hydrolase [Tumidithrix helvetica PCC 7403]
MISSWLGTQRSAKSVAKDKISKFNMRWRNLFSSLLLSFIPISCATLPVHGAERIKVSFGPLDLGISVRELATFAKEGKVGDELDSYLSRIATNEDRKYIREYLNFRADVKPLQVAQFFYSSVGVQILDYMGEHILAGNKQNGSIAIRAALILAASDPEGLTAVNFLKFFPTDEIRLNSDEIFTTASKIEKLVKQTNGAIAAIGKLSALQAQSEPAIDLTKLQAQNLGQPGKFSYKVETVTLKDSRRNRSLVVDFYLPQGLSAPAPVVILSHGLASNRQHFADLAKHFASYGFVAAVPQHPGSDSVQVENLLKGYKKEIFDVNEFVDRPLDIRFILDEMGRRYPDRVNLQQVAVMGHSFGGYTALMVAGARIDFEQLTKECAKGFNGTNASLLIQCEALKLPREAYNFKDDRVKLVIVVNPIDSSILGASGLSQIEIPVAIFASSDDAVAPIVLEQVEPFTWLKNSERYLLLAKGVGHVFDVQSFLRTLAPSIALFVPSKDVEALDEYDRIFYLAMLETHLAHRPEYRPFLQASYAIATTKDPNKVDVLNSLTEAQFQKMLVGDP